MRITASRIHNGSTWMPSGSVLELSEDGTIVSITDHADNGVVHYEGVLCPGFVNVHCHLELSHMKGVINEGTGLISFLQQVMLQRNGFTEEQKFVARHSAYKELIDNGVVAVGDIANVTDTLDLRAKDQLHIHSFIESIGFSATPQNQFERSLAVYDSFAMQPKGKKYLGQSIVPHAPYSVSETLFRLIDKFDPDALISIHNQESPAEDEYYLAKKGGVQTLLHGLGIDDGFFTPSGKSSLQTYLQWLSASHPLIFVHNTFTKRADIEVAKSLLPEVYWCLCPNANLYIENRLPDIPLLSESDGTICIGTDSLASNHCLSIISELYSIKKAFPAVSWEHLLKWGTLNGAKALQLQNVVGAIELGKQPGINLLTGLDADYEPSVQRII